MTDREIFRNVRLFSFVAVVAITSACSEAYSPSNDLDDPWQPVPGLTVVEILRIGGSSDPHESPSLEVVGVRDIALSAAFELGVVDDRTGFVGIFDEDGRLVFEGRTRGQGPGEFFRPSGIAFAGPQEALVVDAGNQRWSRIRISNGPGITDMPRDLRTGSTGLFIDAEGALWEQGHSQGSHPAATPRWRLPLVYRKVVETPVALGEGPSLQGTGDSILVGLRTLPAHLSIGPVALDGGMVVEGSEPLPFSSHPIACPDRDRGLWNIDPDERRAELFDFSDGTSMWEGPLPAVPRREVTRQMFETALDSVAGMFGDGSREAVRSTMSWDQAQVPSAARSWNSCFVDGTGNLWLEREIPGPSGAGSVAWDVMDSSGAWLGVAELPFGGVSVRPVAHGDRIAGVRYAETGLPQIVVVRVNR